MKRNIFFSRCKVFCKVETLNISLTLNHSSLYITHRTLFENKKTFPGTKTTIIKEGENEEKLLHPNDNALASRNYNLFANNNNNNNNNKLEYFAMPSAAELDQILPSVHQLKEEIPSAAEAEEEVARLGNNNNNNNNENKSKDGWNYTKDDEDDE